MSATGEVRRLDQALVERALAPSRERAQALIAAGLVEVDGRRAGGAAMRVGEGSAVRVTGNDNPWASRAGAKLVAALDEFGVDPAGRVVLDAGASTGGFTDVLLARGARLVYAVDVGHGQLDPRLAGDPRVHVMDRTNLRLLRQVPGPRPDLVTLDLSFISLRLVLPAVIAVAEPGAEVVALYKPQFELGRHAVPRGGVVRDRAAALQGAQELLRWAESVLGATGRGPIDAPVRGTKGNQELLVHLRLAAAGASP